MSPPRPHRALSNAGLWFLGRLQTDADRERVLDGLSQELPAIDLDHTVQRLGPRWFVVRNAYAPAAPVLLKPRQTMTLLRGPMMRSEIRKAREWRARMEAGGQGALRPLTVSETAGAVIQDAG